MVEWCVIVHDKRGSDRAPHRAAHLSGIPKLFEQGKLVTAGAIFKDVVDGKPSELLGSHLVIEADSKDEALEVVRNDPYGSGGVWDLDHITIFPFSCAMRKGKE